MEGQINTKIVGATVTGFALVAGAYVLSNFGASTPPPQTAITAEAAPVRVAIAVSDKNNDGVEDWREDFVTSAPVILDRATSSYTYPDTLTGETSIELLQNIVRAKGYGPFGSSQEEIVENTVDTLAQKTETKLYNTPDITIIEDSNEQDIVNYANTLASILYNNSDSSLDAEIYILKDALESQDPAKLEELDRLAVVYKNYRDQTLTLPVPDRLAKEHLDLINTYNAVYEDIVSMRLIWEDPAVTLLRLKRYQDDVDGMYFALQNIYKSLERYASLFNPDDPAVLFIAFSPDFKT